MSLKIKSSGVEKKIMLDENVKKLNRNFSGYGYNGKIYVLCDVLTERSETPTISFSGAKTFHLLLDGEKHDYDVEDRSVTASPNGYFSIDGFPNWNNYTFNGYFDSDIYANYDS